MTTNSKTPGQPGLRIPVPGPPTNPAFRRRFPPPPAITRERQDDATYVLDTGIGLAFAHVDRLDLLTSHYGEQVTFTSHVRIEWRRHAQAVRPLTPGHTAEDKREHDQKVLLRQAALRLIAAIEAKEFAKQSLRRLDNDAIDALVADLCALDQDKPDTGGDRGECASIQLALDLIADGDVVLVCTNDGPARKLAQSRSINHRNMHTVLVEMRRADLVTADEAWDLYQEMTEVTMIPASWRPSGPADYE